VEGKSPEGKTVAPMPKGCGLLKMGSVERGDTAEKTCRGQIGPSRRGGRCQVREKGFRTKVNAQGVGRGGGPRTSQRQVCGEEKRGDGRSEVQRFAQLAGLH